MAGTSGPTNTAQTAPNMPRPRRPLTTRWLRAAVPAAGAVLLAVVVLWPVFREQEPGFTLSFSGTSEFEDRLRMKALKFEGTDSKNRPFVVTADSAFRKTQETDSIQMNNLTANVTLENDLWLNLKAGTGIFRNQAEEIHLSGMADLFSSRGYEIHGRNILVDLATSRVSSPDPVTGQGPLGTFEAGGFRSDLKTENLTLTDQVTMTIYPGGEKTETAP